MTSESQFPEPGQQAEHTVRVCVPAGFFERLTAACDFREVTQPVFALHDLRPQSSEVDPVLFFKIIFLEYILDVSSDALRKEFTAHSGLRLFLNIDDRTALPAPEEIVLFRGKLGWLGFKSLLDEAIRMARKNGLPEADCVIMEKRSDNPLVEVIREMSPGSPATITPSSPVGPLPPAAGLHHLFQTGDLMPYFGEPTPSVFSEQEAARAPARQIKTVESSVYVESSLHAAARMLWGDQPETNKPLSERGSKSHATPPNGFGPQTPATIDPLHSIIESLKEEHVARTQKGGKGEPFDSLGDASTKSSRTQPDSGKSVTHSRAIRPPDAEFDPLGIESFFDGLYAAPPERGSRLSGETEPQGHFAPPLPLSSNAKSPAPLRGAPEHGAYSSEFRISYDETQAKMNTHQEERNSLGTPSGDGSKEGWENSSAWVRRKKSEAEDRSGEQPGGVFGLNDEGESTPEEQEWNSSLAAQVQTRLNPAEVHLSGSGKEELSLSSMAAYLRPKRFLSTELIVKGLYIAVPLLVLLAVYVMIGVLRNTQPGPAAVESAKPAPSGVGSQKPTNSSVPQTSPAPTNTIPGRGLPPPIHPKQGSITPLPNGKPASETVRSPVTTERTTSRATENRPPVQSTNGSSDEVKKLALIRHLKQKYGLDFQPGLYTYRELKDINDRMEETLKKAVKR
ncbi:MAG: hypothetical protein WBN92_07140 [Terriglobia bacterium]